MLVKVNMLQITPTTIDITDECIRNFFGKLGFNESSDIDDCLDSSSGYLEDLVQAQLGLPNDFSWELNGDSEDDFYFRVKEVLTTWQTEMRQKYHKKVIEEFLRNHFDKIHIYDKSDFIDYRINKSDIDSLNLRKE